MNRTEVVNMLRLRNYLFRKTGKHSKEIWDIIASSEAIRRDVRSRLPSIVVDGKKENVYYDELRDVYHIEIVDFWALFDDIKKKSRMSIDAIDAISGCDCIIKEYRSRIPLQEPLVTSESPLAA